MSRTSLQDVRSVGDPLQSWNWDLLVPNFPGSGDSRPFTYKVMTTSIPGMMMDNVPVALHGVELRFAGRANYSHQLELTVLETRDADTRRRFRNWRELARSWEFNTGTYKDLYSTSLELLLYDDLPQVVRKVTMVGAWPENVADSSLDGSTSAAVTFSVTFSYDYLVEADSDN